MTSKKSALPKGQSPVQLSLYVSFCFQSHSVQRNEQDMAQTEDVMDENIDQTQPVHKKSEQQALIQTPYFESKQNTPFYVYFLTAFAAIGGFLFGYDTGVISGAMILIKEEFGLSSFWQELIVSVTIGAAILGALLGGFLNHRLGRKPLLGASAMVFTVGAVVMGVAHSREILLIGRLTVGFGIGKFHHVLKFYEFISNYKRNELVFPATICDFYSWIREAQKQRDYLYCRAKNMPICRSNL